MKRATRGALAVLATAAIMFTTVGVAAAKPAPAPTATLSCTFNPDTDTAVAAVTVRHVRKPVRWAAFWVHTDADVPTTTKASGRIEDTTRRVLRFKYDATDDLLEIRVWRGDNELLWTRADSVDGCGVVQTD